MPINDGHLHSTLDFEEACQAHARWRVRFRAAINNEEMLDAKRIAEDHHCDVGVWLHGDERKRFRDDAVFVDCVNKHAAFHRAAGEVAVRVNAKDFASANDLLAIGTEYSKSSAACVDAIRLLAKQG
jgi:hypothetical protein